MIGLKRIYLRSGMTGQFPLLQSLHLPPPSKTEEQPKIAAMPSTMVMPKQATERCSWGPHCPICKNKEEDWDGDWQNQPRRHPHNFQHPQPQNSWQSFDILNRYSEQIRLQKEWEEKIERLNEKYNLDYYSSLESDSDSDQEQDYRYEHKYETLI